MKSGSATSKPLAKGGGEVSCYSEETMAGFTKEQRTELQQMLAEFQQSLRESLHKSISSEFRQQLEDYRYSAIADMRTLMREELTDITQRLERVEALVTRTDEDLQSALREIEAIKVRLAELEQQVRTTLRTITA